VTISTGVTSDAESAREALDKNSAAVTTVIEALKADGIDPKDIRTTNLSVQPLYQQNEGPAEPRIIGYRVTVLGAPIAPPKLMADFPSNVTNCSNGSRLKFVTKVKWYFTSGFSHAVAPDFDIS
jgi:hypothetical protein